MKLKEIKPGMVIHCKTNEEKKALLEEADKDGKDYGWAKVLDYIGVGWDPDTIGDNCKGQMRLPLDQMV